jgi:hypothetical protein
MLTNHDSDWNIEDVTDTEICAAIRYLEPDQYIALLVCFAFFWFYWR